MNPPFARSLFVVVALLRIAAADAPPSIVSHASSHADGRAAYSFDASAYTGDIKQLPVGVFDSGIGGLTVLEAILSLDAFNNDTLQPGADGRRDFENERFIYFGDQANMPYGNYPGSRKEDYLRELILKDAIFLLGRRAWPAGGAAPHFNKPPVKAIVIACNTATAYGLEDIRAAIEKWNIPVFVIGVVEAGARGVSETTRDGRKDAVAVLATVGTCNANAYPRAIGRVVGLAGKSVPGVVQQGCVSLAGAIEGDPAYLLPSQSAAESVVSIVRSDVTALVEKYRADGGGPPISRVVLGCTHFPLVQREIADAFSAARSAVPELRNLIAERIEFVNPAELTAKELFRGLASARLRLNGEEKCSLDRDAFFISVPNPSCTSAKITTDGSLDSAYKYGRMAGRFDVEDTIVVPMQLSKLPKASVGLIEDRLPEVAGRLGGARKK
ncbi:MAG: aspartate/glutamate racemase family protein [Verrucomicrobiaceae bacterium]|nr:aspartate/glutamate racemase family protein [Verrucomicrobiaceae bacterium]